MNTNLVAVKRGPKGVIQITNQCTLPAELMTKSRGCSLAFETPKPPAHATRRLDV
jgi:hypothetical protein